MEVAGQGRRVKSEDSPSPACLTSTLGHSESSPSTPDVRGVKDNNVRGVKDNSEVRW